MDNGGLNLLIALVFGVIVALLAQAKGRNAFGWFFVGFFLSCIGLVLILCMSDLEAERAREQAVDREQRRLKEQLRQERLKRQSFEDVANRRLDAHDEKLGMNTNVLSGGADRPPPRISPGGSNSDGWYFMRGDNKVGPMTEDDVRTLYQLGNIPPEAQVWNPFSGAWEEASMIWRDDADGAEPV